MRHRYAAVFLVGIALLLLASNALAMSSDNFRLEWFTPFTTSGGGPGSSASYGSDLSVGQTAIGAAANASYGACVGYWCAEVAGQKVFLPLVIKASS
jgi:hypothetical protein